MAGSPGRNHQCSLRSAASKPPGWAASPFLSSRDVIVIEAGSTQPDTPGTKRCSLGDFFECARLGKEVRGAGDDNEPPQTFDAFVRLAVELEDLLVVAADDEQGRARSHEAVRRQPDRGGRRATRSRRSSRGSCAAATSAAAGPGARTEDTQAQSRAVSGAAASHRAAVCSRSDRSWMSKTLERSLASSSSRRSIKSVPRPASARPVRRTGSAGSAGRCRCRVRRG